MGALFGGAALAKRPDTLAAMLENTRVTGGLLGTNPAPAMAGMLDGGGSPAMQQQAMPAVHQPRPTFGSTGQPFDYEAARNALVPPERKSSTLQTIAQIAVPAMLALSGNQAGANDFINNMAQRRRDSEQRRFDAERNLSTWRHSDWARQNGADLDAAAPFTIGRDRLAYNPATGGVQTLFDGKEDWESYASSLSLTPGTPQYDQALQDYVLRSAGPTATENFATLDDHRTTNDVNLENVRFGNRSALEGQRQRGATSLEGQRQTGRVQLRGAPTHRDTRGAPPRTNTAPTATAPDGRKLQFVGGKWVPLR